MEGESISFLLYLVPTSRFLHFVLLSLFLFLCRVWGLRVYVYVEYKGDKYTSVVSFEVLACLGLKVTLVRTFLPRDLCICADQV